MSNFTLIDMEKWGRREQYKLYTDVWGAVTWSFTKKIDITEFIKKVKEKNLKFTPSIIYVVNKALNNQINFKMSLIDGKLGYFDVLNPTFPVLSEDGNMVYHSIFFNEDFNIFYNSYVEDMQKYPNNRQYPLAQTIVPPQNNFIISVMPFLSFDADAFTLKYAKNYYSPFFIIAKYEEENGKIMLPISITMNHAVADGYHLKIFFEDLEEEMKKF